MGNLLERIRQRKIGQWALAYLAGAWLVLQVLDLVADPWALPAALVRAIQVLTAIGFLATLVLAWYHGERGAQTVGAIELTLLAGLFTVGAVALMLARTGVVETGAGATRAVALPPLSESAAVVRIAVLPPAGEAAASELSPDLVQRLLSLELSRRRGLAVMDPLSLNSMLEGGVVSTTDGGLRDTGLEYAVRTTHAARGDGAELGYILVEVGSGEVLSTGRATVTPDGLGQWVQEAAGEITETLDEATGGIARALDLVPWLTTATSRVEAAEAFLQGTDYAYRGIPGGSAHFERAIALDPEFIPPRIWLVPALVGEADTAAAREHVRALRSLESRATPFERAMISWADAVVRGDTAATIHHLQVALGYSPRNNVLLYNLGLELFFQGRITEALEAVRPAVESRWRFSHLYVLWGILAIRAGEVEGLRETLEWALPLTPQDPYVHALLAGLASFEGDHRSARRYAAAFSERLPDPAAAAEFATVYEDLAAIAHRREDRATAVRLLRNALDLDPDSRTARLSLGRELAEAGDLAEARAAYDEAVVEAPDDPKLVFLLGEVAVEIGRRADAARHFARYLELEPGGASAPEARARMRELRTAGSHP